MGSNRRYGSDVTGLAIAETVLRPMPLTLEPVQFGRDVHTPPRPVPVLAWIDFPQGRVEIPARATAWTPRAVRVEFELRDGLTRWAWLWRGAVRSPAVGE